MAALYIFCICVSAKPCVQFSAELEFEIAFPWRFVICNLSLMFFRFFMLRNQIQCLLALSNS